MKITRIQLENWRNFRNVDVQLSDRNFMIGPNACGKSNLLDAVRFVKDIADPDGGLQKALDERNGIEKIRFISARYPQTNVKISFELEDSEVSTTWKYSLELRNRTTFPKQTEVAREQVWKDGVLRGNWPGKEDEKDPLRLTQTRLEQVVANRDFRPIAECFSSVNYLHLVPQLIRYPQVFSGQILRNDPFGQHFLERLVNTPEKTRNARLRKIEEALKVAVPQLSHLNVSWDKMGIPHIEARYDHWRPHGARQTEEQFSDGTLRLVGLLWTVMEQDDILLLEEPELSLHAEIVSRLPALIHRITRKKQKQLFISTHSSALLSDRSISAEEILLLSPTDDGTRVELASSKQDICAFVKAGMNCADIVFSYTKPDKLGQLDLFE